MKKIIVHTFTLCVAAGLLVFAASCNKDNNKKFADAGPKFSLDKFEQELQASMEPSGAVGWAYVINQNGLFARGKAYGSARNKADGDLGFTLNKKINMASVSKYLTAIAVMQLMDERNLDITAKVADWLPPSWTPGLGVANLTFGDLLSHASGLASVNSNFSSTLCYSCLRSVIANGVVNPKTRNYLNANFALFRVLIPSLWKGLPGAPAISPVLDSASTEQLYIQYMQDKVFEPIGITGADCEPEARATSTLYYATTDGDATNGAFYNSWTSLAGGGGYFLSAMQMARVLAYYRHTEVLLSNEQRKIMEDNRFGFNLGDNTREIHGTYYSKNGSIINNGQGVVTEIAVLPNGIEVVTLFNSQGMVFAGGVTATSSAIYDAYNKSWE
jgi:D-alanyl-D-alanine carboxypeptidase